MMTRDLCSGGPHSLRARSGSGSIGSMRILMLLIGAGLIHAQEYDLLLKGGHVIDPKNRINGRRDVAIKDARIAAVAAAIPTGKALKTVNVTGLFITPGLVDLHVHVFAGTGTEYTGPSSVRPDD